jgi:hypothetical protein
MRPSLRVLFLISAASVVLHVSLLSTLIILAGYIASDRLDLWLSKRKRKGAIDEVIYGWKACKDSPDFEEKGNLTRMTLPDAHQVLTARIADLLQEMW